MPGTQPTMPLQIGPGEPSSRFDLAGCLNDTVGEKFRPRSRVLNAIVWYYTSVCRYVYPSEGTVEAFLLGRAQHEERGISVVSMYQKISITCLPCNHLALSKFTFLFLARWQEMQPTLNLAHLVPVMRVFILFNAANDEKYRARKSCES